MDHSDKTPDDNFFAMTEEFVERNAPYYRRVFSYLSRARGYRWTFNLAAGLLGPLWFGARGLWHWFLISVLLETGGLILIAKGLIGDLGSDLKIRFDEISLILDKRLDQLAAAKEAKSGAIDSLQRTVDSLKASLENIQVSVAEIEASWLTYLLAGLAVFLVLRLVIASTANWLLEHQFSKWRADNSLAHGWSTGRLLLGGFLFVLVSGSSCIRFARPEFGGFLIEFPRNPAWRLQVGDATQYLFDTVNASGRPVFETLRLGLQFLLDWTETIFVSSPWAAIAASVIILAYASAGVSVAILSAAGMAFLGLLGFWEKAMTTLALLGTASLISISLGIPFGILCAKRERLYVVVRPILDFMQSMPSFVYLIPVVAFFGSGKPAGVVATMIFGSPPVIRFTVLGIKQVPEAVREAALSFGATSRYLLWKVELPLAARTIMAGVNQTILLSLAMVVIASLIGAKGLGEDVLEALQYAAAGQGILAGFAILICALILDRIVAGKRK